MNLGAIILAAGFSSRMGKFKPLLPLGEHTMLEHAISLFKEIPSARKVVVTGYNAEEVKKKLHESDIRITENPHVEEGMFSSIQAGVAALGPCDGFFVLPVDIPLVRPATIATLGKAYTGQEILFPVFAGKRGHPPLIPGILQQRILQAEPRETLRNILAGRAYREIAVWDAAILEDADTPEAYGIMLTAAARRDILTIQEADIFAKLHMPERGLLHGKAVAAVALLLARGLPPDRRTHDTDLLYGSALLHDIAKGHARHEKAGAEILRSYGLNRMADIVAVHTDLLPPRNGILTETELVYLADKLVRGTRRVSLEERFQEKLHLYHDDGEACKAVRRRLHHARAIAELWEEISGKKIDHLAAPLTSQSRLYRQSQRRTIPPGDTT